MGVLDDGSAMDWRRVRFTEHMTEAAAVVGACRVVLDFGSAEHATYEVHVLEVLKGTGASYFATGTRVDADDAFRPFGEGDTPEDAAEACLASAGVHHRRRERQAGD